MKPLTKTVVSRGGGIAARFASYGPPTIDFGDGPQALDRLPQAGETIVVKPKKPAKPRKKEPFDRITYQREYMRKRRAKAKEAGK